MTHLPFNFANHALVTIATFTKHHNISPRLHFDLLLCGVPNHPGLITPCQSLRKYFQKVENTSLPNIQSDIKTKKNYLRTLIA